MGNVTRREALAGMAASIGSLLSASPGAIETHVHLFDPGRVPYAPDAPYKPAPYTLADHLKLVEAAGLEHSIIVHPEPYQDDHRYLEYCLANRTRSSLSPRFICLNFLDALVIVDIPVFAVCIAFAATGEESSVFSIASLSPTIVYIALSSRHCLL